MTKIQVQFMHDRIMQLKNTHALILEHIYNRVESSYHMSFNVGIVNIENCLKFKFIPKSPNKSIRLEIIIKVFSIKT